MELDDYFSVEAAFESIDIVIHCAALVSFQAADKQLLLQPFLLTVFMDMHLMHFVHISNYQQFNWWNDADTVCSVVTVMSCEEILLNCQR